MGQKRGGAAAAGGGMLFFRYWDGEVDHQRKPIAVELEVINQSVTNIFEYSNIFHLNTYLDIRSYHFLDTNIFGYSFVSTFGIRICSDIRS